MILYIERPRVKDNLNDLYSVFGQYKYLYEYYWEHEGERIKNNMKSKKEIESRVKFILKHKIKQCGEVEALCWVLGVDSVDEIDLEAKDSSRNY